MSAETYDVWYVGRRQLEAGFARDHKIYELELKATLRPSNICSAVEASKEEMDFATELDSLSLSLMTSNTSLAESDPSHVQSRTRANLPYDAAEQLHWNLESLALDRGACGVEYAATRPTNGVPSTPHIDAEDLWRKPRGQS